jgi:hypothetical protein
MILAFFFSQTSFVYMSHSTFSFGGQVQWIFYLILGGVSYHGDQKKISAKEQVSKFAIF